MSIPMRDMKTNKVYDIESGPGASSTEDDSREKVGDAKKPSAACQATLPKFLCAACMCRQSPLAHAHPTLRRHGGSRRTAQRRR